MTAEPIAVDLVTPDELAKRPDEKKPEEDKPQQQVPKEESTAPTQQAASPPPPPAAEPVLIEGTASMEGLELKKSAIEALSACQPYDMLPVDRYGEWKVLDLPFRPQDFG